MKRCHHIFDPEAGRVHIPGCMGAAVYGPHGCTCYPERGEHLADDEEFTLEDRLTAIEERLVKLETSYPAPSQTERNEG